MITGSDIENGFANSLTDRSCFSLSRASKARRVWIGERGERAVEVRS